MARILIGCECSGMVRRAFAALGHAAVSCDLKPADDRSPHHFQGDLFKLLTREHLWDLVIAHPPCTYLCSSGLHWNKRRPERAQLTEEAIEFAERIWACREFVKHVAIENPKGCLSTRSILGKASQYIQPYEFGHDASKSTGLWLHNLPLLVPLPFNMQAMGRMVEWPPGSNKPVLRYANQTDSGQNRLPPGPNRAALRSETYEGIAKAMAEQWGPLL